MSKLLIQLAVLFALATNCFAGPEMFLAVHPSAAPTGHRYWRLIATSISWYTGVGDHAQAFFEIGLYASTAGTGTNLSLAGTAAASSIYSGTYPASNGNDGNASTFWTTVQPISTIQWWGVDLGAAYSVHSAILTPYLSGTASPLIAESYDLQYCTDNTFSSCTTQSSFATANTNAATQTFSNL